MSTPLPLRTAALRALIVSVIISGLLGVIALLGGTTVVMGQVLLTSLCGTAASLLALIGSFGLERPGGSAWGLVAIVGALFGFGLLILGIWAEFDSKFGWRVAASGVLVGTTAAHAVLLGLARLQPKQAPAAVTTRGLAVLFASLLLFALWGELEGEGFWRITGAIGVLVAAGTLLVPILARMARAQAQAATVGLGAQARFCPACGQGIQGHGELLTCRACGASFRVTFEGAAASPFQ